VLDANIASVKRYGDRNGVPHRFLIFHVIRTDGRDFYLRMDRRRDPTVPLIAFGIQGLQTRLAKDTVCHESSDVRAMTELSAGSNIWST